MSTAPQGRQCQLESVIIGTDTAHWPSEVTATTLTEQA